MALTKISGEVLQSSINIGVVTASQINVGSAVTIHSAGFTIGSSDLHSTGLSIRNINSTGVVTATTFSGNLTGNVTGNATGLSGTPNITVSAITAASAVITGNVSVAGTVTYEDTTNVDSVGVITARSGVRVSAGSSVGIGTNNPAEQLELTAGSERLMIGANSPSTYSRIAARNTANSGYRGLQIDGSDLLINSNTSGNILACTGGGNLGIGTASPGAKLDVNGSSKFNGSFTIQSSGTTRGYFGDVDGTTNMQLRAENAIEFKAGGNTERMRILSGGNVGIGFTNPRAALHVGSIIATVSGGNGVLWTTYGALSSSQVSSYNNNLIGYNLRGWLNYIEGGISNNNFYATNTASYGFSGIEQAYGGYINFYTCNTANQATTANTTVTPRLAAVISPGGNTGIGTDNPTQKLHVQGDVLSSSVRVYTNLNDQTDTGNIASGTNLTYRNMSGFHSYTAAVTCNNTWYTLFPRFNDTSGVIFVTSGDASSKNVQEWAFNTTSPGYGVNLLNQLHAGGSWNTGSFSLSLSSSGNNLTLQAKATSYYSSGNIGLLNIKLI
jgi:hypothetical protein